MRDFLCVRRLVYELCDTPMDEPVFKNPSIVLAGDIE